jgi:PAS domain S-box-containing protein
LAIVFLAFSAVILLIANSLQIYFNYQIQKDIISNRQLLIARDAANTVKSFIQSKFGILKSAAVFINHTVLIEQEQKLILDKLLGLEPAFRRTVLFDAQWQEVAKSSRLSSVLPLTLTEQVKNEMFSRVSKGKKYISLVYIDEVTSEPMVIMAVPVQDIFGEFKGALLAEVNLKFMWDLVGSIKVGKKGLAYVVDRQGNLLAAGDISRVLKGENLSYINEISEFVNGPKSLLSRINVSKGFQNTYVLSSYVPLGMPDWAVVVEMPVREAYSSIITLVQLTITTMLFNFSIALAVGVYLSKKITEPVIALCNATEKIGKGIMDTKIEVKSCNEIGQLAASFNQMVDDLNRTTVSRDALMIEVEERKKAEEEIRKSQKVLQDMIDAMPFGMVVIGRDRKIKQVNAVTCQLSGHSANELIGQSCSKLFCIGEKNCPVIDLHQDIDRTERKMITVKNKLVPIIKSAIPIRLGEEDVLLETFVDITELKEAEKKLKQLNDNLADTVAKLEQANRELKNFVYIASHDLREPLRKISSFGRLLQNSLGGKLTGDDLENLQFMIDGATRMTQMVEGLLSYSRVSTKGQQFETVNLSEVISDLKNIELAVLLEDTGAVLDVPDNLPQVNADPVQIRQLFQNLIANGIKYQPKDTSRKPQITIRTKTISDNIVRIEISDNGIGIKKENLSLLFTMFKRLHSRSEYEGTGIGLAVCKKIVERHGGQIGVESEYGKGSTFWFTLQTTNSPVCAAVN